MRPINPERLARFSLTKEVTGLNAMSHALCIWFICWINNGDKSPLGDTHIRSDHSK